MSDNLKSSSLSRQLIITIILFSSIITLVFTGGQLYIEYQQDTEVIEARLQQVQSSYQRSIEGAIWTLDKQQLQLLIDGILELPDIDYAEIISDEGFFLSKGNKSQQKRIRIRHYELSHTKQKIVYPLGTLTVIANLNGAYNRLLDRIGIVLLSNALKTFLVALFITFLLNRKVLRHLHDVSNFLSRFNTNKLGHQFILKRKTPRHGQQDELDILENSVNQLRSNLNHAFADIQAAEQVLQTNHQYLQQLDIISTTLSSSRQPEERILKTLKKILELFDADRAWLLYPNNPKAATYQVPLEVTHADYPGVSKVSKIMPVNALAAEVMSASLSCDQPVAYEPPHPFLQDEALQSFKIQSQLCMAIHPKQGQAWLFGLHQCRHPKHWTKADNKLFAEIAHRMSDSLANYIYHQELLDSESRLAEAQQIAHVGHWEYDMKSKKARWSDELFRIIGYPPQSFVPNIRHFAKLIHPDDRSSAFKTARETNDAPIKNEYRIIRPDGSYRFITSINENFIHPEQANRLVGIIQDVTERKQLEKKNRHQELQLIQADKMSSLGLLVSGVAHEINNPNNLIQINALLLKGIFQDVKPLLAKFQTENSSFLLGGLPYDEAVDSMPQLITELSDASRRIERIIIDLKNFARRSNHLTRVEITVNDAIESAVRLLQPLINSKTHKLQLDLAKNLPHIKCNLQHLEQILINLLVNALDALPDMNHKVWVSSVFDEKNSRVLIRIKDNGVGISESDLKTILEPFFTTKQETGGTGLGLSIAFTLTKEYGGKLSCSSIRHEGSLFTVSFPVA